MKNIIVITACILLAVSNTEASPPGKPERYYSQANGEKVLLKRAGNAQMHWFETRKGHIVTYNSNSRNYEYAVLSENNGQQRLTPSGVIVGKIGSNTGFKPLRRSDLPSPLPSSRKTETKKSQ